MSSLGEMNDTTKVRTAEDVERKYRLDKVLENIEVNDNKIVNLETELNNFVEATTENFEDVQEQLDGKVETWYYSGIPSLSNLPASDWTTSDEKDKHIGDLYYDRSTGYVYRFELDTGITPNVYKWQEIHDEKAVDALSIANAAQDTADSKRRTFVSQPTPPYDNGDLWLKAIPKGTTPETYSYEIWGCQVARQTGSYVATDWRLGATDDTYATAIVDELGGTTTTILSGQVVQEMANYTKFTDLATGGSTTIAGENITTGSIKSQNYVADTSGTKINLTDGSIDTKNFKVDSSGNVIASNATITGGSLDITTTANTPKIILRTDANNYLSISPNWTKLIKNGNNSFSLTGSGVSFWDNDGEQTDYLTGAINLSALDFNDNPISLNISANPGLYGGHFIANGVLADNLYSTTEIPIGTWIDGKKIWRKVINTGNVSSATKVVAHGITGITWVVNAYGMIKTGGTWYHLDRISGSAANQQIAIVVTSTEVQLVAGSDASFSQGSYVVIEYTKD